MKSSEANDPKNTATDKTSGEVAITLPFNKTRELCLVLQSIEDEEARFAEIRTEHKDTMEKLHNLAYKLRREILTGQVTLPLEAA